jgi:hypothetical protein
VHVVDTVFDMVREELSVPEFVSNTERDGVQE